MTDAIQDPKLETADRIAECENSKRIIKSTTALLKEATYQGSKHKQVSESLNYLDYLLQIMDLTIEELRTKGKADSKKDAKKNAIEEAKASLVKEVA